MNIAAPGSHPAALTSNDSEGMHRRLLQDLERQWLDAWRIVSQDQAERDELPSDLKPPTEVSLDGKTLPGHPAAAAATPVQRGHSSFGTAAEPHAGPRWAELPGNMFSDPTTPNVSLTSGSPEPVLGDELPLSLDQYPGGMPTDTDRMQQPSVVESALISDLSNVVNASPAGSRHVMSMASQSAGEAARSVSKPDNETQRASAMPQGSRHVMSTASQPAGEAARLGLKLDSETQRASAIPPNVVGHAGPSAPALAIGGRRSSAAEQPLPLPQAGGAGTTTAAGDPSQPEAATMSTTSSSQRLASRPPIAGPHEEEANSPAARHRAIALPIAKDDMGPHRLTLRELSDREVLASMRDTALTPTQSQLAAQGLARALMEAGYARVQVVVNGKPAMRADAPSSPDSGDRQPPRPHPSNSSQGTRHGH